MVENCRRQHCQYACA